MVLINHEKIFSSIYQDVYRISAGVIFLVNKFSCIRTPVVGKVKKYKGSKYLRVLTEDCEDITLGKKYPKGTVLYNDFPVHLVERPLWTYELKLCSGACMGSDKDFTQFTSIIEDIISGKMGEMPDAEEIL